MRTRSLNRIVLLQFLINGALMVNSLSVKTSIFYYPWYGNPGTDGHWIHWDQNNHQPPDDIGANFYPSLSAYSSRNAIVLVQHMSWLRSANVGILVTSWWGKGTHEDHLTRNVLDAAREYGLEVAFHIEPYSGRSAASIKDDIQYIYTNYGTHPAFHKQVRSTKWGPSNIARGVFYIFESLKINDASWTQMLDSIRGTVLDSIVIGQTTDISRVDSSHFDGLYTYDAYNIDGSIFKAVSDGLKQKNSIFSASLGPGYVDTRAVPGSTRDKSRQNGNTYDSMWQYAINAQVEWVSITSFNEWHEGSQIEPAIVKSIGNYEYMNYEGAYGKTGSDAQNAYLNRTAYWINLYEGL
ncbi:unnamed protein product [Rotaria socialis]|uniref:Uncharacterized protein n=1 Tax=Rotaria socialis TaxID=392032 RepID=A0A817L5R5_9BILA|nr:unnamed protein product [Rotaria socialis]CAF3432171.1 unnamed protein product [Rotaria socialis]CAF4154883.1 unnamed protein product [Rotaria socialis]CAF4216679.1 unnamed protein product [Rotaria socialis]